jgi:hypothetical protein
MGKLLLWKSGIFLFRGKNENNNLLWEIRLFLKYPRWSRAIQTGWEHLKKKLFFQSTMFQHFFLHSTTLTKYLRKELGVTNRCFTKILHVLTPLWGRLYLTAKKRDKTSAIKNKKVVKPRRKLEKSPDHNVCKTVWLSEALLVFGEMTWTLLADSLDKLRKCLKSAFLLSHPPRAAGQ